MLKRIISIVLLLCLIFSTSVIAENTNAVNDETTPETSQEMSQDKHSNMDKPPSPPNREMLPEGINRGQIPSGNFTPPHFNQNTQEEQETGFLGFVKTYSTPITSVILLALAFIFVVFYRRKNY